MQKRSWPFEEQTYLLRKHIFAVRNTLKAGWPERVYHQALVDSLRTAGIPVSYKPRRSLIFHQSLVHTFEPDLIAWDELVLELKVLPYDDHFAPEHLAQIIHYLKFFQMKLGLLVNFAPTRVKIKRILRTEPQADIHEELASAYQFLPSEEKALVQAVLEVSRSLLAQFGLGYAETIYRKLMELELQHTTHLPLMTNAQAPVFWQGRLVDVHATPCLLLNQRLLIHVTAITPYPHAYEFTRMKSYLANLNLPYGLLVHFGRQKLHILGITP